MSSISKEIESKLAREVTPYLVSSKYIKSLSLYRLFLFSRFANLLGAGLLAAGISVSILLPPVQQTVPASTPASNAAPPTNWKALFGTIPLAIGTVLTVVMAIVRDIAAQEDKQKAYLQMRACVRGMGKVELQVRRVIASSANREALITSLNDTKKAMDDLVDQSMEVDAWPWPGPKPGIQSQSDQLAKEIASSLPPNIMTVQLESDAQQRVI